MNRILQSFITISVLNITIAATGRIFKKNIILYSEISVLNLTYESENSRIKSMTKGRENSNKLEVEISKPLKSQGDVKSKINKETLNKKTEISSINIVLTCFVISCHLLIISLIVFLIFKSNKEAERRLRSMLKYKPQIKRTGLDPLYDALSWYK